MLDRLHFALRRISAAVAGREPDRRRQRANWLMHRPLEGRGLRKQQQLALSSNDPDEPSSDSSDETDDEILEQGSIASMARDSSVGNENDFRV